MIYANSRSINSPTDWQRFGFVLYVPVNSDRLEYGLALRGEGQVWIDDVRIEFVGDDIETSSFETSPIQRTFVGPSQPGNLDFESDTDLQAWFNSGNPDYEAGAITAWSTAAAPVRVSDPKRRPALAAMKYCRSLSEPTTLVANGCACPATSKRIKLKAGRGYG
jgi:hypothetical protein